MPGIVKLLGQFFQPLFDFLQTFHRVCEAMEFGCFFPEVAIGDRAQSQVTVPTHLVYALAGTVEMIVVFLIGFVTDMGDPFLIGEVPINGFGKALLKGH